ncbi:MAG: GAF domain-containing protein [Chitinophagaceae bacterium]|nr:GAF domain-containing protein [Anaerolineae bacterium]
MNTAPTDTSSDLAALGHLIRRQAAASAELTTCTTFEEMAAALGHHILDEHQFISINVFTYSDEGEFTGFKTVATANRQKAFSAVYVVDITLEEVGYPSRYAIEDRQPVVVTDIQNDPQMSPKLKNWSVDYPILSSLLLPMRSQDNAVGLINLNSTAKSVNPSPFEIDLYQSLADQVGALVRLHRLIETTASIRDISQRQSQVMLELVAGQNVQEMAQGIARYMLPQQTRFLCVNQFIYDERRQVARWQPLITVNQDREFDWNQGLVLTPVDQQANLHQALQNGEIYLIEQIDAVGIAEVGNAFQKWMQTNSIVGCLCVPIKIGERLFGSIVITSDKGESFPPEEVAAFSNIINQMGAALQIRQLLDETREAQTIASSLVSTNRALAGSETYLEMSATILQGMPEVAKVVGILMFDTAVVDGETPNYVVAEAIATRTELDRPRIVDPLDSNLPGLVEVITQLAHGEPIFLQDTANLINEPNAILPNTLRFMSTRGMGNFMGVGLRAGSQVMGILAIGSEQGTQLEGVQLDNVLAIADQLSLTFQNRRLLDQTAEALGFVQAQYETTNAIFSADQPTDMLAALYAFTDGTYERAHIALIDPDAPQTLMTIAEIDGGDIIMRSRKVQISQYPDLAPIVTSEDDLSDTESMITNAQRAGLANAARGAFLTLPLTGTNRHLFGLVNFSGDTPGRMPFNRTRALRNLVDQVAVVLENQRLLRDTQTSAAQLGGQVRVLQTINQLATSLTSAKDEQTLLDQTCQALVNALRIGHASIALMDDARQSAFVISEYPDMAAVGMEISPDNKLQAELRREMRPIVVNTANPDPRLQQNLLATLEKMGIVKLVLLPLVDARGEYIGTVTLDIFDENFQIDPNTLDIARTITAQIGVSLQNIRLLGDSQKQAQQFQQIAALGQLLQSTLEIDDILKIALTSITRIVSADHISVIMFDAAQNRLQAIASRDGDILWVDRSGKAVEINGTTAGRVWRTGEGLRIGDLQKESQLRHTSREDVFSVMAQPIFARGVVLGLVEIASHLRDVYDATTAAIFQQLVSQLSVALENADAYGQSQRVAKSKALINDISSQLQRQVELEQMLDVTMSELGKALGARRARIRLSTPALLPEDGSNNSKTES